MTLPLFAAPPAGLAEPLGRLVDRVPADWQPALAPWRDSAAGLALLAHVDGRVADGATVYPAQVFRALELTRLADVRVVILGQDPYHGPDQAHGLAFSVPDGQRTPPSLRNILHELRRDLGVVPPGTDLSGWAAQGVLLLNTSFTVEQGLPASHARRGWEALTESLLRAVAARPRPCAYLLWGAHAQALAPFIRAASPPGADMLVLCANHPSPLSARRPPVPFLGCGHFGAATRYLGERGLAIDWAAGAAVVAGRPPAPQRK